MRFIADPSLPGHGDINGVYLNRDRSIAAVTSAFRLLIVPRGRTCYGGARLRHRVALYHPPACKPFAVFDGLRYRVNDVTFHPTAPVVAIATGSYDGGFFYNGELVVWDWEAHRHSNKIGPIPEVVRCTFSDAGSGLVALVRPWDDEWDDVADASESAYEVRVTYSEDFFEHPFDGDTIARQISAATLLSAEDVASHPVFSPRTQDRVPLLRQVFKRDELVARSPIWDVAWLGDDRIAIVHNDCQLEIYDSNGVREQSFVGPDHGTQILKHPSLLVHTAWFDDVFHVAHPEGSYDAFRAKLLRYDGTELHVVAEFEGQHTFSASRDGWILGRRQGRPRGMPKEGDVIGGPSLDDWRAYDFGHCDTTKYFVRVDECPYLLMVYYGPPPSDEHQKICSVSHDGSVRPLWPLLPETQQAREFTFAYVADSVGEGLIVSGYNGVRQPYAGFICRKTLQDGQKLWHHDTRASATTIKAIPSRGIVLAAFLNGEVAVFESDSGNVVDWTEFRPDGELSVIFSIDVSAENIVFGTIDGRVGILPIGELLSAGIN